VEVTRIGGILMIDVLIGGTPNLFTELLSATLRSRGLDTELASPDPPTVSLAVARSRPAVCLIDQRLLARDEVLRLVVAATDTGHGRTRVIVLGRVGDAESVRAMRAAGASGFVHSSTGIEDLLRALECVRAGGSVVRLPRSQYRTPSSGTDVRRWAAALTGRERECLSLLVDGVGTGAMARTLAISELTVRSHVQRLLQKLGAHTRLEAASLAVRYGLLDDTQRPAVGAG
jgi:two-component system nitrate/nitrite response regulator NarL